nr:hypothetical protein [Tanacetum cinerariifolium]
MSNKAADNMSSGVEQPTTDLSPDMPNDPVVQSNKDLALNEQPNGVGVDSKSNDVQQAKTDLVAVGTSSEPVQSRTELFLGELTEGVNATVVVMVCRSWDVHAVTGRYLSPDFVLSDAKVSKVNIAHNFLKLKDGSVYLIRDFVFHPNKDEYRIFRDHVVILEFDGETFVRKSSVKGGGFVRYPFELQDLGNIELINNKYLIAFHAVSTSITLAIFLSIIQKPVNAGDAVVGGRGLGDTLIEIKTKNVPLVVLTAMNVKQYNNKTYLSSSSSTQILDDPHTPTLKEFKKGISDGEGALNQVTVNVEHSKPKDGTLENLLIWAQNRKNDVSLFFFVVTPRHYVPMVTQCYIFCSFNLPPSTVKLRLITLGPEKAGTTRPMGALNVSKVLIERLEASSVTHAISLLSTRFRLELDISDQTASTVVVMFDDTATELVKCSADSIVQAKDEVDVHAILPRALENVIGTTHILELKSHAYYEHGTFESFTCWRIIPGEVVEESVGLTNVDTNVPAKRKRVKTLALHPSVELEDLEKEMASAWSGAQENAKDDSASGKGRKEGTLWMNLTLNKRPKFQ